MAAAKPRELPILLFKNEKAWDTWLSAHYDSSPGVRMRIAKKASDLESVTYPEVLDVAICHGWIDGLRKSYDDKSFLQKFTPRGPKSIWSKINKAKATAFIEEKRMKAGGHAAIAQAKANGQWDAAYDGYRTSTVPDDLEAALKKNPKARKFFETLGSQNRYAVLFRIQTAKTEVTRKRRIEQFVAMLNEGKTLH